MILTRERRIALAPYHGSGKTPSRVSLKIGAVMKNYRILYCGDTAFSVEFGSSISPAANALVHALAAELEKYRGIWLTETVPSFRSLLVIYDPVSVKPEKVKKKLEKICGSLSAGADVNSKKRTVLIPVCYGGKYGEDLEDVARINSLTAEEVIKIHSGTDYLIYMLGFLPGFPYLGGLDSRLETPRLDSPRTKIPAGSVGIGRQSDGNLSACFSGRLAAYR